jgi:hypothetical protein
MIDQFPSWVLPGGSLAGSMANAHAGDINVWANWHGKLIFSLWGTGAGVTNWQTSDLSCWLKLSEIGLSLP